MTSFDELPQVCRDLILSYWSYVKEIEHSFEAYRLYEEVGEVVGRTGVDRYDYFAIMSNVKQFAYEQITRGLQKEMLRIELYRTYHQSHNSD